MVAIALAGLAVAQELTGFPLALELLPRGMLSVREDNKRWELSPQGPQEELDLRVMGLNDNSLRNHTGMEFYGALATHVLVVVDRQLANEAFRRENCETSAAKHVRALMILPASDMVWRSIQLQALRSYIPGGDGRLCATIKGRYYGLRHFFVDDHNADSQFDLWKKQGNGMPGFEPRSAFVTEGIEWLPCER